MQHSEENAIPLCPARDMNNPFVQNVHPVSHYSITVLVLKSPSFYLLMAPRHKNSDAGDADMPKRIHKVLPLSESSQFHKQKEEKCMLRLLRSTVRTHLLSTIVKKEKEILAVRPQTARVMPLCMMVLS